MRKKRNFMLTMFKADSLSSAFCGQIKMIETGKVFSFRSMKELQEIIATQMSEHTIAEQRAAYHTGADEPEDDE